MKCFLETSRGAARIEPGKNVEERDSRVHCVVLVEPVPAVNLGSHMEVSWDSGGLSPILFRPLHICFLNARLYFILGKFVLHTKHNPPWFGVARTWSLRLRTTLAGWFFQIALHEQCC